MKHADWSISRTARAFGLSRSTLLYYDRLGLLRPGWRTDSGYRYYSPSDRRRLEQICLLRQAGVPLQDVRVILEAGEDTPVHLLQRRLAEIGREIEVLRQQRRLLSEMIGPLARLEMPRAVDKELWIAMLRAAGMDQDAMSRWHQEFERRAPAGHQEFLVSLGIPPDEICQIRAWSRSGEAQDPGRE